MRYAITQYNVVWYQMIQDSIVYYNTIPYNAIQHSRISYTHRHTHRYTHRISSPPLYIALHVRQHSYGRIVTAHLNNMLTSRRTSTDRCTHRRTHTLPPTTSYYCYARADRHVWHRLENIISQARWCGGIPSGLGPLFSCIMSANAGVSDVTMDIRV